SPELLAAFAAIAITTSAQDVATLTRAYADSPNLANRTALVRYASAHKDVNGALALLAVGAKDAKDDHRPDAERNLSAARERLPQLGDYIDWLSATVAFDSHDFDATSKACEAI